MNACPELAMSGSNGPPDFVDETALLLGMPGKIGGHGSDVDSLVQAGRLDEVRAYCECDVLNTTAASYRLARHNGLASAAGHDASVDDLVQYLERERRSRPHLRIFADRWTRRHVGREGSRTPKIGEESAVPHGNCWELLREAASASPCN